MQTGWIEIFFLAMLAGFIALRLYNVLGRRTGHEKPVSENFRSSRPEVAQAGTRPRAEPDAAPVPDLPADIEPGVRPGIEAVMSADRNFQPGRFLASAQTAYGMTLEAFWQGDLDALKELVADEIYSNFRAAIEQRKERGEFLDNRLLQVDRAAIVDAHMNGAMAEVTVRFDAEIVTVTKNREGAIVAGSANETVQTHDLWTFSRHTASSDPSWLLVATDEEL